jgi:prephenate dehydratase
MSVAAIQGVRGSYSEEATHRLLGLDAEIIECVDFAATFDAVANATVEYAVIPIENKIVGEIEGSMSLLRAGAYRIFEKLPLKVMHVLAGTPDSKFELIRSVRSHVEALKQCRHFLTTSSHLTQVIGADTASSVRLIVDENITENAAIGSRRAAEIYGAKIIADNIADDHDNWTTFYLIGR